MGIVARQSIKGTIINYIGVAVGFVTTFFVMTKYLTAEEVGLTRVLTDAAILMSSLAQLGTNTSAMRYYPYFKDDANRDNGFFGWTILIPAIGFVMFLILFFIFKDSIVYYFSESSSLFVDYLYFVIPMSFFMLYLTVFETNSNVLMRIAVPKFIREVGIRVFTLADYLFYAFDIITLDGMVIGLCLAYVIATLLNVVYLLSLKRVSFKIKPSFVSKSLRRDFLLYTFFLLVSSIVTNVPVINTFFIFILFIVICFMHLHHRPLYSRLRLRSWLRRSSGKRRRRQPLRAVPFYREARSSLPYPCGLSRPRPKARSCRK